MIEGDSRADSYLRCVVAPAVPASRARAKGIAALLSLPLVADWRQADAAVALVVADDDAWLQQIARPAPGPIHVDFSAPAMEYRRKGGQNELLGKAVGVKGGRRPRVVDATAGLGRDAFVLADLGCQIKLIERSEVLAWLLEEAVRHALISGLAHVREAAERMTVVAEESTSLTLDAADALYLDPMFTERKGKAAVKKDLTVLQALHGDVDSGEEALWAWAWRQPCQRIVVKRPAKVKPIGDRSPSHSVSGKSVRFDVYVR